MGSGKTGDPQSLRPSPQKLRRQLKLYLVMGSGNCRKPPVETLIEAIYGGITMFQFREKGPQALQGSERDALALELRAICRSHGIPFIVNDDVDLALRVDADGVHVGQEDESAAAIRKRLGEGKILGVSAHHLAEAQQAIRDGADYIGVGPMYPTSSKDDAQPVQGPELVWKLRQGGIVLPLVGIGGITADNASPVLSAGADGLAVISAITGAEDVRAAVKELGAVRKRK